MNDVGIVRNRAKIEATIDNAKAYLKLRERTIAQELSCGASSTDGRGAEPAPHACHDIPAADATCRSASPRR